MADMLHQRPSSLMGWNEENEWLERYLFDSMIMAEFVKERNKEYKNASRHR